MQKTKILSIRSLDRDKSITNSSDSNFIVKVNKISKVVKLEIQNIIIPLTFYNIDLTNNSIQFNDGTFRTVIIPYGTYNITQLINALQSAMNAASVLVFTFAFNSITQKITISTPAAFALDFTLTTKLASMLGFEYITYSGSNSYTAPNVINISRIFSQINIHSSNISRYNEQVVSSNTQDSNLICRINNSIFKANEYLYYSNDDNSRNILSGSTNSTNSIEFIDIQIKDLFGTLIEFNGNDGVVLNFIVTYLN